MPILATIGAISAGVSAAASLGSSVGAGIQSKKFGNKERANRKATARTIATRKNLLSRNVIEEQRVRSRAFDMLLARGEAGKALGVQSVQEMGQRGALAGVGSVVQKFTDSDQNILMRLDEALQNQQTRELAQEQKNLDEMGRIMEAEAQGSAAAAQQAGQDRAGALNQMVSAIGSTAASVAKLEPLVPTTRSQTKGFELFQAIGGNQAAIDLVSKEFGGAAGLTGAGAMGFFQSLPASDLTSIMEGREYGDIGALDFKALIGYGTND